MRRYTNTIITTIWVMMEIKCLDLNIKDLAQAAIKHLKINIKNYTHIKANTQESPSILTNNRMKDKTILRLYLAVKMKLIYKINCSIRLLLDQNDFKANK